MKQIYGIDLSKGKFDVNFVNEQKEVIAMEIKNDIKNISFFLSNLPNEALLVAEHTGTYGDLLLFLANLNEIDIALSSGYNIRHSLGLRKGKTDKLDASRIREYGERFYDKLKLIKINSELMIELQELYALRGQLVKERKMLITQAKSKSHQPLNSIIARKIIHRVMQELTFSIQETEQQIINILNSDQQLKINFELAQSVKGIGIVTACELIIKTGNFNKINTAKKAASYAGICPFPNASGKMVKKSKVSPMSDKKLKSLLFMCAKSAVKYNKEYKLYYLKKELEGKPYFLIMTNVANKLLRTIYKVIETGNPWDPNYICIDPREKLKKVA